jgi:hypothetical protein
MTLKRMVAMSWDVVVAVAAAITAALWLPPITLKELTTELIAFFTIQSAIILPAMIFTAGVLRGDGLTLSEVDRYHSALRRQMHFWTTLLFLDLLAAGVVIIGKAADWRWKVTVWHWSHGSDPLEHGRLFEDQIWLVGSIACAGLQRAQRSDHHNQKGGP